MWIFSNLASSSFLVVFSISLLGAFLWVTYSLQEFIIVFRKNQKNRALRHKKQIDLFQQQFKKSR